MEWINPMYLDTGVVKDIRARFKEESEIQLQEFLLVNFCSVTALELTTPENTITYHNALCLSPQNFT